MDKNELLTNDEEQKTITPEEETKQVAELFGLSLSEIEQVKIGNKEYFKINIDGNVRMIENISESSLLEQFRYQQDNLSFAQSDNEKQNAREIFNHQLRHQNIELSLSRAEDYIDKDEVNHSRLVGLKPETKSAVSALLRLHINGRIQLEYINLSESIAIDINGRVISATFVGDEIKIESATVIKHEDQKVGVNSDGEIVYISDMEIDSALDTILVPDDEMTIEDGEELFRVSNIIVGGVNIETEVLKAAKGDTTQINDANIPSRNKEIYRKLIEKMNKRKEQKRASKSNAKQYVLSQNTSQAAFIDSIFMSLLLGFGSGLLLAVIMLAIRSNI